LRLRLRLRPARIPVTEGGLRLRPARIPVTEGGLRLSPDPSGEVEAEPRSFGGG